MIGLDAPTRVTSGGGKLFFDDDQQTPDTQVVTFDFPGTTMVWEHRVWSKTGMEGDAFGMRIYGEKGTLVFDKNGWHVQDGDEASDKASDFEQQHKRNFLDCIKDQNGPTRTLRRATRAHGSATSATSPTASAASSGSTPRRRRSRTTRRRMGC